MTADLSFYPGWNFPGELTDVTHFEFGVTLEVVERARSDYFMSMGGASFYGGLQTDAGGRGNIAIFSVWTSGGSGEITFLNTNWGFEGSCEDGCFDGACGEVSGCSTISHHFLWASDPEATRTKVVGRRVAEGVWDLEGHISHSGVAEEWVHMATIRRSHPSQTLEQILGHSFSGFLEDFGGGACYQGLVERVVVEYREPWLVLGEEEQLLEVWVQGDSSSQTDPPPM